MTALKKLLVCEFITGGGVSHQTLPESLANEGMLMRDALLRDLNELKQYALTVMCDFRLMPSPYAAQHLVVQAGEFESTFKKALKNVDLVWLIAPETDGILISLAEVCLANEENETMPTYIGCGFDATLIGTSKSLTFEALQKANIHTLPVYADEDLMNESFFKSLTALKVQKWVAKPEDGAGCEGIFLFDTLLNLRDWLKHDQRCLNYLAQPFQSGLSASFSFLCAGNQAWLLCANQQLIVSDGQTFKLTGIIVNGMLPYWQRFETLMRKLIKVLPDAMGYIGVDVIIDPTTEHIYVIDINPRLSSSYIGLSQAIGHNLAKIILDCLLDSHFKMPLLQKNVIEVKF
ncbi:MAG: ATP-grasp domain-containing protein [Methylophilaceae bacterium]